MIWSLPALASSPIEVGLQLHGQAASRSTEPSAGIGASVAYRAHPMFAVELAAQWNPALERRGAHRHDVLGYERIIRPQAATRLLAVFSPIKGRFVRGLHTPFAVDLGAGFGLVQTVDDLEALNVDPSDPEAQAAVDTASQWHPMLAWRAGPRLGIGPHLQLGLFVAGTHWVETIETVTRQPVHQVQGTMSATFSF